MSSRLRPPVTSDCKPQKNGKLRSYAEIIQHYIDHKRPQVNADRLVFKKRTLKDAIHNAALAKRTDGKRHDHFRRFKSEVLEEAELRLQACAKQIKACGSFKELHDLIHDEIRPIDGIGALAVYDIACAIGANLGLDPKEVYLHAGTRKGANILNLGTRQKTLDPDLLPAEFKRLKPREIEDCLCSYAKDLRDIG